MPTAATDGAQRDGAIALAALAASTRSRPISPTPTTSSRASSRGDRRRERDPVPQQERRRGAAPPAGGGARRASQAHGALLVINDDAALCEAVDADGVHVGETTAASKPRGASSGPERIVGVSCYDDFALAEAAVAAGADYVAFGSFFPSSVKPDARRADISLLRRAATLGVPVVAIGGIDATNAARARARGRRTPWP